MTRIITHRCTGTVSPTGGWCEEKDRLPCPAVMYSDGIIENSMQCGEPCSWIMGKSGHGDPPWQPEELTNIFIKQRNIIERERLL